MARIQLVCLESYRRGGGVMPVMGDGDATVSTENLRKKFFIGLAMRHVHNTNYKGVWKEQNTTSER